ncbi:unnamed protein product [Ambrosiozyma monospora]|uniref:Unnamed protein product n=1 Tax=Ambrosiozyma monospora TaxID=43982 RepID=A0A9W6Z5U3_AMBMO|nr:unnamed protein product [Ambrosiozyma monospora]
MNLAQAAEEVQQRLISLFVPDEKGNRPYHGNPETCNEDVLNMLNHDEHFSDLANFYEYFDGDTGRGLGSKWQCGWTALVARFIQDVGVVYRPASVPGTPKRRKSYYDEDEICNYEPRATPFPPLVRRKSGKSLVNLAAHKLDLDAETPVGKVPGALSRTVSNKSFASSISDSMHDDFLSQVKEAMTSYHLSDVDVPTEELETRNT